MENGFEILLEKTTNFNNDQRHYIVGSGHDVVVPGCPITFHDRHIDPILSLQRVEIIPSMTKLFADISDEKIRDLQETQAAVYADPRLPRTTKEPERATSWDIARAYSEDIGSFCSFFPSNLYIEPKGRNLYSAFTFYVKPIDRYRPTFQNEAFLSMDYYDPETPASTDPGALAPTNPKGFKRPDVNEIKAYSRQLAIWEFYPMTLPGEKIIKTMQTIPHFIWETSQTKTQRNPPTSLASHPMDDQINFLPKLLSTISAKSMQMSRGKRAVAKRVMNSKASRSIARSDVVAPSLSLRPSRTSRPYRMDPTHFLQHAWARAVVNDATFIVLSCGRYERIGFRHRASQTLYLSGPIDTVRCQNPTYGKIHLGLAFAITQDFINRSYLRIKSISVDTKNANTQKKRKATSTPAKRAKSSKRQRVEVHPRSKSAEPENTNSPARIISAALSSRNLALVNLNYGVYQSPVPSSFIRREPSCAPGFYRDPETFEKPDRKTNYCPHQHFTLNLREPFENGATGTIHRASAEIKMDTGEALSHSLIIKLVFLDRDTPIFEYPEDKEETEEDKLLNEYMIYQHLAAAGVVEGILPVYGLFEDIDSGTLALIMDDGGTSLMNRELETTGDVEAISVISQTERESFLRTLKNIHQAGIRHGDIRSTNLVVNSNGAFIIDFDRGQLRPREEALERELLSMQRIVDGLPHHDYYSF